MGQSRGGPYRKVGDRYIREYVAIFLDEHGDPPWECTFCDEPVMSVFNRVGVVHHLDDDETNNDPDNLGAAHHTCHSRHHSTGRPPSDKARAALAKGQGRRLTDAQRAHLSEINQKFSPETRDLIREIWSQGYESQRALAKSFDCDPITIGKIVKGVPRQKRCRKGHLMTPDNTYHYRGGTKCLTCNRQSALDYYHRSKGRSL